MRVYPYIDLQRWLSVGVSLALLMLAVSALHWLTEAPAERLVHQVDVIVSNNMPLPPASAAGWKPHRPTDERMTSAGPDQRIWFRIPLRLAAIPNEPIVVYLPHPLIDVEAYLNEEKVTASLDSKAAQQKNPYLPLYRLLQPEKLRVGENTVLLRMSAHRARLALPSTIYVGPSSQLALAYKLRYWVRVTLNEWTIVAMIAVCAIMASVWLHRRRDTIYLWLGFTLLLSAARNAGFVVGEFSLSMLVWEWLLAFLLGNVIASHLAFLHRFIGRPRPRMERAVFATVWISGPLLLLLIDNATVYSIGLTLWYLFLFSVGVYIVVIQWRQTDSSQESRWLLVSTLLLLIFGGRDLLLRNGVWPSQEGVYLPYGMLISLTAYSFVLLRRFVNALQESENLSQHLERRVAMKHEELQRNYATLRQLEQERVLIAERERIMRDMHDGVGGNLVGLISMAESEETNRQQLSAALRHTLDDLRLVIHSLDSYGSDLGTALAVLRPRFEATLRQHGATLHWNVTDLPFDPALDPGKVLQITRVVQEAVTNTLKHACAKNITIEMGVDVSWVGSSTVSISIADDGRGFSVANQSYGQGLANMRRRAELIEGALMVETGKGGTVVTLTIGV